MAVNEKQRRIIVIILCVVLAVSAVALTAVGIITSNNSAVDRTPISEEKKESIDGEETTKEEQENPAENESEEDPAELERLAYENNVRALAIQQGISTEELLKKIGLENSGLTETSTQEELWEKLTIESYAKFNDSDVNEFKAIFGIEDLENDMLWTEAERHITIGKIAEVEYGLGFEQFALEQGLPEEVTSETTLGEFEEIMNSQQESY